MNRLRAENRNYKVTNQQIFFEAHETARQQATKISKLQETVSKLESTLSLIPNAWQTVASEEHVWQSQHKLQVLNRLLSVRESMTNSGPQPDLTQLKLNKASMDEVNKYKQRHDISNEKIAAAKNEKEQEPLLAKRAKNSTKVLSEVQKVVADCDRNMSILQHRYTLLQEWTQARSGYTKSDGGGEYKFKPVSNEQFNRLMERRESYLKACKTLTEEAQQYLKCLTGGDQLLTELKEKDTVEEKEKEKQELEERIAHLTTIQSTFKGIQQHMDEFTQQSDEVKKLIKEFKQYQSERSKLTKEIAVIDVHLNQPDDDYDDDDDDDGENNREKRRTERQEKENKLAELTPKLRTLERQLLRFSHYGEVKKLLPKTQSTGAKFKDYTHVRDVGTRGTMKLYRNTRGEEVILKRFFTDEKHVGELNRQLSTAHIKHPLILPINNIVYDKNVAYIETPYISGGNLRDWLENGKAKTGIEIQNMIRLIAQGIDFLHTNGIIHCDLSPEKILIKRNEYDGTYIPIIYDFTTSRNKNTSSGISTIHPGKLKYRSPERYNTDVRPGTKADVWAFGIIILELVSHPRDISTHVATHFRDTSKLLDVRHWNSELKGEVTLYELLVKMLQVDEEQRLEIADVAHHAFLNRALVTSTSSDNQAQHDVSTPLNKSERVQSLKKYITQKSMDTFKALYRFSIDSGESNFAQSVIQHFYGMKLADLTKRTMVSFKGEQGVDVGALTTSFYTRLFNALASSGLLLEKLDDDNNLFTVAVDSKTNSKMMLELYEGLGKALIKMIYDQRTMPIRLAPYLMRYLLLRDEQLNEFDQMLTLSDVDMVDASLGNQLRFLLVQDDVDCLMLDFSELDAADERDVTNANKKEYIKKKTAKKLYTDRMNNMRAMRKGFRSLDDLVPFINQLNETDLAILISDQLYIDKQILVERCLHFTKSDANFEKMCKDVLSSMSDEQLQRFLFFATGKVGMFNGGSSEPLWNPNGSSSNPRNRITIVKYPRSDRLPVAHVCFYAIDMPAYASVQVMKQKLNQAISSVDDSFAMA